MAITKNSAMIAAKLVDLNANEARITSGGALKTQTTSVTGVAATVYADGAARVRQVGLSGNSPTFTAAGIAKVQQNYTAEYDVSTTANDSNKTFVVPASEEWEILNVYASLLSSTTVAGNRQMQVRLTDGSNNEFARVSAGAVQAAGALYYYNFFPGASRDTSFYGGAMAVPFPRIPLPAGYKITVRDSNSIAATTDDMTVRIYHKTIAV
jgi:hypothetical protein